MHHEALLSLLLCAAVPANDLRALHSVHPTWPIHEATYCNGKSLHPYLLSIVIQTSSRNFLDYFLIL